MSILKYARSGLSETFTVARRFVYLSITTIPRLVYYLLIIFSHVYIFILPLSSSSMPATSTSESKPLLYPLFIYLLLLSWLPFPFLQCISTIYSLLYLQDTLSRYHRIRLRVSSFYLIVFYLLLTYYCRVFIYNRFVPTIQSLPPYPTEEYLFTTVEAGGQKKDVF